MTIPCPWRELDELRPILRAYLRQRLRDDNDVEDIVQDCLLRAARFRAREREPERLTAWMIRVAENALCDHRRRMRRRPVLQGEREFLDTFEGREETPGEDREDDRLQLQSRTLEREKVFECLATAIRRLDADDQRVLDFYYSGFGRCRDIARVADVPPDSVKARLFRARRKLSRIVLRALPELGADGAREPELAGPRAPRRARRRGAGRRAASACGSTTDAARGVTGAGSLQAPASGASERARTRAARLSPLTDRGTTGHPVVDLYPCGAEGAGRG